MKNRRIIQTSIRPKHQRHRRARRSQSNSFQNHQTITSTYQSFQQLNSSTQSNTFDHHRVQIKRNKSFPEYSTKIKNRRRLTIRRYLWTVLCLCTCFFFISILTIVLLALLLKSTSTITTTTTQSSTVTSSTTLSTMLTSPVASSTTLSTAPTTTQSSTVTSSTTLSTTSITTTTTIATSPTTSNPSGLSIGNATSGGSNYYAYETIEIGCSSTITNLTIEIFVQLSSGATYLDQSTSIPSSIVTASHTTTATQIIYTWTIIPGQVLNCVAATYNLAARFTLYGIPQNTSLDTYIITTTTSPGTTTVFTGHF